MEQLRWCNRNLLERAAAGFPHTLGSLKVVPKASPFPHSAALAGSFGPHESLPHGHALLPQLLLHAPVPGRKRRAKCLCQLGSSL